MAWHKTEPAIVIIICHTWKLKTLFTSVHSKQLYGVVKKSIQACTLMHRFVFQVYRIFSRYKLNCKNKLKIAHTSTHGVTDKVKIKIKIVFLLLYDNCLLFLWYTCFSRKFFVILWQKLIKSIVNIRLTQSTKESNWNEIIAVTIFFCSLFSQAIW